VQPNSIQVVSFDCDGVMFDSSMANRSYYNHILNQFGLPPMTDLQFAYAHMHTVDEALRFILETSDQLEAVQQYRRRMSYDPFIRDMVMEPHLRDLLERLRPTYKTAVATNRTNSMGRVLEEHGLETLFDKVVTASDVSRPKPFPDELLALLDHFGIAPSQMIFIGDSELDAVAAARAKVPFVAYGNPRLEALAHIQRLEQVSDILAY
jgi:phosphoglycolate phosphatase